MRQTEGNERKKEKEKKEGEQIGKQKRRRNAKKTR
jgi:hypothetical protein